jgi:putative transposase
MRPALSVSRLVNSLKLVQSRLIRKERFPEVRRPLWGELFRSPSYCDGSCGGASLQMVRIYIKNQPSPKISQARALVRFSRCRAAQEAARGEIGFERGWERGVGCLPGFVSDAG